MLYGTASWSGIEPQVYHVAEAQFSFRYWGELKGRMTVVSAVACWSF